MINFFEIAHFIQKGLQSQKKSYKMVTSGRKVVKSETKWVKGVPAL